MRNLHSLAYVACLWLIAAVVAADQPVGDFFVAVDGDDGWSGTLAAPNGDRSDGPFGTIDRARQAVRDAKARELKPYTVRIASGVYRLAAPIIFGPEDGGTASAPVTYVGQGGEATILSGGERITGWRETKVNSQPAWVADLPEVAAGRWSFRQLFVNGQRRDRPRLPKDGFYRFTGYPSFQPAARYVPGQNQAFYAAGEIQKWKNVTDVEVVILHYWVAPRLTIAAVDEVSQLVTFTHPTLRKLTDSFNVKQFARFSVENVFEALDAPGQWYLDRPDGKLYYLPMPGEKMDETVIVAPRLKYLVQLEGSEKPVQHLILRGLGFAHAENIDPAANASDYQASNTLGGAVVFKNTENCRLADCRISQVSGYAVEVLEGCKKTSIVRNTLNDLGGGGIKVWHESNETTVSDNDISHGGLLFYNAVGLLVGQTNDNLVTHNHIHHFYYTGVSVGWSWNYGPSKAARNIVEYNHIHHIGQGLLSDMAGVYTLGVSPGTRVRNNLIHDIEADNYGGWGLYCDEGSSEIVMENNVVYRTTHGGFHQHYGKENIIRNNIFAIGQHAQIMRSRQEEHISFTFERNILYFNEPTLLGGNWNNNKFNMDHNLYWRTKGQPFDFNGSTFEQWQKNGHDTHSMIADPLFVDPSKDDFRLKPDSPAIKQIGFAPIDLSTVGPRVRELEN